MRASRTYTGTPSSQLQSQDQHKFDLEHHQEKWSVAGDSGYITQTQSSHSTNRRQKQHHSKLAMSGVVRQLHALYQPAKRHKTVAIGKTMCRLQVHCLGSIVQGHPIGALPVHKSDWWRACFGSGGNRVLHACEDRQPTSNAAVISWGSGCCCCCSCCSTCSASESSFCRAAGVGWALAASGLPPLRALVL